MRGQKTLLVIVLAATTALPQAASAQFSRRGLIGAATLPFRAILGRFGHFPHGRHMAQEGRPVAPVAAQFGDGGPAGWPSAYADVLGFTFWPARYVGQLRAHGFDVIAVAVTEPPRGPELARNATTGAAVESDGNANPADACGQAVDVKVEWPVSQIEETTQLNDAPRAALDKLRTALAESVKNIRASCRDLRSLPPIERLKASVQQLWAVRDAGIYIRTPLKAFYDSLSAAQQARFAWKQPADRARADDKAASGDMARQYQACAAPSEQASERLLGQIEQQVRPSQQQADAMQSLRKTAGDMAKLMTAPCAQPIPTDPLARLDAANDQLSSISYAATSMEIALAGFYAQLDAEQKAKFDSLGR